MPVRGVKFIEARTGVGQGNVLGGVYFCVGLSVIVRKARELTAAEALQDKLFVPTYMDDQQLAGGLGPAVKFFAAHGETPEPTIVGFRVVWPP